MKNLFDLYCIDVLVNDVKTNSKDVGLNDLFICVKGVNEDRHNYIDEAIKNGASSLIVSHGKKYPIPYIKVKNANKELINVVNNIYDKARDISLIAITGTDGKTTTASIIRDMLGSDRCGYIGTNGIKGKYIKSSSNNTTPAVEVVYKYLDIFYKEGLDFASIEASSEGMLYKRLEGLSFKVAVFTNFTEDHLNVHKTLDNYLKCKRRVFNKLDKDGYAILNRDDKFYKKFKTSSKGRVLTYGKSKYSSLRIVDFKEINNKTKITYRYKKEKFALDSPLLGEFNVYNFSAAVLVLLSLGYSISDIRKKAFNVKGASGRCEILDYGTDYKIVLDYAHTENGIKNILAYLNTIKKGRIITVVGSAGGREKEKRKKMGHVSQELSDIVIYTMDDPRGENVLDIINELIDKNISNYIIECDREKAIFKALDLAKENDIVAILGKGRDNYMAIGNDRVIYSDIFVLDKYFK